MKHLGHRPAKESGHDGRGCLVGSETVRVGGRGDGGFQKGVVLLHGGQHVHKEGDELQVALGILAGSQKHCARVGAERPVVVLSGAVDPGERLLVEKDDKTVLAGDLVHQVHHQLVLVIGQIGLPEDRGKLELIGRHLVVPCLQRNTKTVAGDLKVAHELGHTSRNGAEIVVVQLLVLGGVMSHQGAAGDHQVRPRGIEGLIDKEIFLLPSKIGIHLRDRLVEESADQKSRVGDGLESLFQRGLVVQRLAGVGDEHRRDAERVINDEHRGSRIPGRVAPRLEGGADAAVRARGGVRLLLGEGFSIESLDDSTLAVIVDQGIVLLGGTLGQRLEPVRHMGDMVFHSPLLHTFGHSVSGLPVQ